MIYIGVIYVGNNEVWEFIVTIKRWCLESTPIFLLGRLCEFIFSYNTSRDSTNTLTCGTKSIHLFLSCLWILTELGRYVEFFKSAIMIFTLQFIKHKNNTRIQWNNALICIIIGGLFIYKIKGKSATIFTDCITLKPTIFLSICYPFTREGKIQCEIWYKWIENK